MILLKANLCGGWKQVSTPNLSAAKQSKTREARVEKYMPHMLKGKGLDD